MEMKLNENNKKNNKSKAENITTIYNIISIAILAVLFITLALACKSDDENTVNSVSENSSVSTETVNEDSSDYKHIKTDSIIKENDEAYVFESQLSDYKCNYYLPDDMEVLYSDDINVEFVSYFPEEETSSEESEESKHYERYLYSGFTNVRNTEFVDPITYTKALMMNNGFNNVYTYDATDGNSYIVSWSNLEPDETTTEYHHNTVVSILRILDTDVICTTEDNCTHTEFLEQYYSTADKLDKAGVEQVVDYLITQYEVGKFE